MRVARQTPLIYLLKLLSLLSLLLLPLLFRHVEASCLFDSVYVASCIKQTFNKKSIYKHRTYLYEARDASRITVSSTRLSLAALTPVAAAATAIFTCRGIVVNRVFHSPRYWRWSCPFAVCRLSPPRCVLVPYMQLVKVNCYFIIKEEEKNTDTRFETRRSRALIISSLLYSYSFYG